MKIYAQFLCRNKYKWSNEKKRLVETEPYITEALATDGVCPLDGRKSLGNLIADAKAQLARLKKHHDYVGFRLYRASRFTNPGQPIYEFYI